MEQEIIIPEKQLAFMIETDLKNAHTSVLKKDDSKNFLDEIYESVTGGHADPNQPSIAGGETTIAGSSLQIGNIPTMDGGGYIQPDPLQPNLMEVSLTPQTQNTVNQTNTTKPVSTAKFNIKKWVIIVVVIVFIVIFLKGLFK